MQILRQPNTRTVPASLAIVPIRGYSHLLCGGSSPDSEGVWAGHVLLSPVQRPGRASCSGLAQD